MKKIFLIAGTRPNFMKLAPIIKRFPDNGELRYFLIHTGQHYDYEMSRIFFEQLEIPEADFYLGVGSGTQNYQIANIMLKLEELINEQKPDIIVVVGDVNSTLAAALSAVKCGVPVAHIEAGLRSFDETMPEEINRKITDSISTLLFTHCEEANKNLMREGISPQKIHLVGNVMIDNLLDCIDKTKNSKIMEKLELDEKKFAVLTLHRASNVDNISILSEIMRAVEHVSNEVKVVFPVHPRAAKNIEKSLKNTKHSSNIHLIKPLGFIDFLKLMMESKFVLTDSGGIQEETSFLGIPCITIRENTERPITTEIGTNILAGIKKENILNAARKILDEKFTTKGKSIPYWDGKASDRIIKIIKNFLLD